VIAVYSIVAVDPNYGGAYRLFINGAAYDPSASDRTTEQSVKHRIEAFGDVERCAGWNTLAASTIDAREGYER
jgi:hypothetical protein